jgi:hypothetical protein
LHLTPSDVRYVLENSQAKVLIVSADLVAVAEQAARDLPRLPSGKMLRRLLMDRYRAVPPS